MQVESANFSNSLATPIVDVVVGTIATICGIITPMVI
jgi:hypothetical protein